MKTSEEQCSRQVLFSSDVRSFGCGMVHKHVFRGIIFVPPLIQMYNFVVFLLSYVYLRLKEKNTEFFYVELKIYDKNSCGTTYTLYSCFTSQHLLSNKLRSYLLNNACTCTM